LWGIAAMSKETTVFFTKEEILALLNHPLTDKGLAQFLADHKKANS
jgi:hypothetical protein